MAKARRRKPAALAKRGSRKTNSAAAKRRPRTKKKPLRVKRKTARVQRKRARVQRKKARVQPKGARVQPKRKLGIVKRAPGVGPSIDALNLVDYVVEAARSLLKAHPSVVFTSGRRNVEQQANAMAGNVVKNRNWIAETYRASPERAVLQAWIDDHPEAVTKAAIAAGLVGVMSGWSDTQKGGFSRHFSGQAFDVRPVANGGEIKATIRALPNLRKFLEKEGGLIIWHADFEKA